MRTIQSASFLALKMANEIGKPGEPIDFKFDYPLDPDSIPVEPSKDWHGVAPDRFSGHETQVKAFVPFMNEREANMAKYITEMMGKYHRGGVPKVVTYQGKVGLALNGCTEHDMDEFEMNIDRLAKSQGLPGDGIPELEKFFQRMLFTWLDHGNRSGDASF